MAEGTIVDFALGVELFVETSGLYSMDGTGVAIGESEGVGEGTYVDISVLDCHLR